MVTVVRKYMVANKMLPSIQKRADEYLALQWLHNRGYTLLKEQSVMYDLPDHLRHEQQSAKCFAAVNKLPLFQVHTPKPYNWPNSSVT